MSDDPERMALWQRRRADSNMALHAAANLDSGIPASQPIHGMTLKQYDRYLHYRMVLPRVASRRLAMEG